VRPFLYQRALDSDAAVKFATAGSDLPPTLAPAQFLAGGTTLLDLMKLDVMRPQQIVDINELAATNGAIHTDKDGLRLGALVRMAEAADHPVIRQEYPVIAQSLQLAASQQIRNMASLSGNVLQRTRCNYFRDHTWAACNKRSPGSGCAALNGVNRKHAILGVSDHCIASYAGDFAQALIALDAAVEINGPRGPRIIRFEQLHRVPGDTPHVETVLSPGDLITEFVIPALPWARRSLYLKVRDRQSYEFALASAAVALDLDNEIVREARIGLGGLATKPWRAREAEQSLRGKRISEETALADARAAFAAAQPRSGNAFKADLGRRTLVRALLQASALQV
jgi:xanthine dehydrogenase YagS FAD-binding subunit